MFLEDIKKNYLKKTNLNCIVSDNAPNIVKAVKDIQIIYALVFVIHFN
jgi:hypothetical protein